MKMHQSAVAGMVEPLAADVSVRGRYVLHVVSTLSARVSRGSMGRCNAFPRTCFSTGFGSMFQCVFQCMIQ